MAPTLCPEMLLEEQCWLPAEVDGFPARGSGKGGITPSGQEDGREATGGHLPHQPDVPAAGTQLTGGLVAFCSQGSVYEPLSWALTLRGTREGRGSQASGKRQSRSTPP